MKCSNCKQANTPERNYCGACGDPLARFCPSCGFRNLTADRFCGGCGAGLDDAVSRSVSNKVTSAPPRADEPASPADRSALAELMEAAREGSESEVDETEMRVSQDDIDTLFGD